MSTATAEATKTRSSAGQFITILGLLILVIPWLVVLYALVTGNFSLSTSDAISTVLYGGIAAVGTALGLGVLATLLNLGEVFGPTRRGGTTIALSLVTAVIAAVLLLAIVLPRASAVQHLNDQVIPFAESISANCKAPLDKTSSDFKLALADAQNNATSDTGFASAMTTDVNVLEFDDAQLSQGVYALRNLSAPETKYQALLQDCITTVENEIAFLVDPNGPNVIPLPAPFSSQIPSVTGIGLLQTSAAVASGQSPFGTLPPGTIEPLVIQALTQVVNTTNPQLTAEGQALVQDIQNGLDTNLSPFKVTVPIQ
ncbi:MAG: hypothetical protein C5B60_07375 [Chloroflexi bacterium]|nr:MAG: hypothetical protein C5B60_07375 [Chloroflexota bacterium]